MVGRIGRAGSVPGDAGAAVIKMLQTELCFPETAPDCDCPFEHWHIGQINACLDVHFEDDGSVHCILDVGDWDTEVTFDGIADMQTARIAAFAWAAPLIGESTD